MLTTFWALLVLAAMASSGFAALWRWRLPLGLAPLEVVAYGGPLGVVVFSLALLAFAVVFGLTPAIVIATAVLSLLLGAVLMPDWVRGVIGSGGGRLGVVATPPSPAATEAAGEAVAPGLARAVSFVLDRVSAVPVLIIGAFFIRWAALWDGAWRYEPDGLYAGHVNLWGDWAQHIGDVNGFVSGDNFPPEHPRFAGVSYAYHYLSSLTAAAMVEVGMGPTQALSLHSFIFSCAITLGIYAFARRLTGDAWTAALGMTLFFLGGGLAWLLVAGDIDRTHDFWGVLRDRPWDGQAVAAANYGWHNVYYASILPQRAFLYGVPLCLLVFTLFHSAVQTGRRDGGTAGEGDVSSSSPSPAVPIFATAGAVAGLLPFAHLGPLPLVAMVALCLFALFPDRGWIVFGVVWAVLTGPQLLLQGDGGGETFESFRTQIGWLASPDPWGWFWLKNLGWFVPLVILGFLDRSLFSPISRRFLWAFMPVFAVANLYVLQPDPWDNFKLLTFWFLAVAIVSAAVLVNAWRASPGPVVRVMIGGVVLSLVLSGVLVNLNQVEGNDRYIFLTTEELDLAARVRDETPPDALFATGLQHNHPVPVMGGRRVVMSYPGWLWPRGIDFAKQEADLRAIYRLEGVAPLIIDHYGVDYVVIGPWERQNFAADPELWRSRYPVAIETANYVIFDVR